jgi:hypothetical protein
MTRTILIPAWTLILLGNVNAAHAEHRRQLDDMAFAVLSDARDIRWAVRDDFTRSPNLRYLCRESDDIFATARNLQDAIFRGRTLPIICNNIDTVRVELCEFEELLARSGMGHDTRHRGRAGRGGHGCIHTMRERIERVKQTLDAMHAIASGQPVVVPPPFSVDPPLPAVPTQPRPHLPAPISRRTSNRHSHVTRVPSPTISIGGLRVSLGN